MIQVIPAIDLIDGKCVRLTRGDFERSSVYEVDPVEMAKRFEAVGLRRLHVVDLDGAKARRLTNVGVLERIAAATTLTIDYGGGIKTTDDVQSVFDAGAAIATIGSLAVTKPDAFFEWIEMFGSERILLGADARDGSLAINGWLTDTTVGLIQFLEDCHSKGVTQAFVTDISNDGMLSGPASSIYREIRRRLPQLRLIASGGVGSTADIAELDRLGCDGVIVGKAIYEGIIKLEELSAYVG
ncbi:MAG TPA: 1-(5-phosphoribosyl)-5-[(5-phosphoribosylamino)methylideneamino]imidazole-4-carboxamide isomerase [Pyrinomonadaceae bacterium]|nr:1-(5-phosphoribosyl)-5-[(5-phosphoribosylamino)methylideneamino]imidazole-4-carboxamide isomerase [Pyrinomonadaceae bacterium]